MKTASETVLLYNFHNKEKLKKLKGVLIQLNIRIKQADHSMLLQPVGYLIGMKGFEPSNIPCTSTFSDELMVMKGFTNQRLDQLLLQIKKSGISPIGLKAVITEHNQGWSLEHLYAEIQKEHLEMSGQKESESITASL